MIRSARNRGVRHLVMSCLADNAKMQAVARLMHPNIVTAYDANQTGDRYYLVMEFVDGPNLDRLVREQGPLSIGLACELMRQAAEGLQYAGDMGMVHRDVKPSNLLVLPPGGEAKRKRHTLKILDFGLARLQNAADDKNTEIGTILARPHVVMGTPDYLSPEQARDVHNVDIRSDLYSLGCTMYFILTGSVPFPDGSTLEKLVRHGTTEPQPIEQLRTDLPPGLAAIVRKLMAKDPASRFQTPSDLATALEPFAREAATPWSDATPKVAIGNVSAFPALGNDDGYPTPVPGSDPGFESFPGSTTEDMSALVSTFPPDLTPTPITGLGIEEFLGRKTTPTEGRRLEIALAISVGVVAAIIGLLALLMR